MAVSISIVNDVGQGSLECQMKAEFELPVNSLDDTE